MTLGGHPEGTPLGDTVQSTLGHLSCGVAVIALAWSLGMLHSRPPQPVDAEPVPAESAEPTPRVSPTTLEGCRQSPFSSADLNLDFKLDDEDWRLMKGAKGSRFREARYLGRADMLGDLVVDDEDENIFCDLFNGPPGPAYADHECICLCTRKHHEPERSETVGESLHRVLPESE